MADHVPAADRTGAGKTGPFEGLTEKERSSLYRLAPVKRLAQGDYLIREGDTDQTAYVILDGVLTIVKTIQGSEIEIADLGEGEWVGEIAFTRRIRRTASARAKSTARVMAINQTTLDALSPETQVYFYRKLNDLAALRVEDLSAREVELSSRNQKLVDYIQTARQRGKVDYSESAMIRGIIQKVPRLPGFATTLVTRLLQEDASPSEVAQHIKKDLALSALVIKTVNGPLYDFATKVTDIHQAVMQLGYIGVYQLVLAEGLRRTMPDLPVSRQVMAHGMAVSQLAYGLSLEIASGRPNEAATIGLVHDVGQNVIGLLKTKNPNLAMLIDALDASHLGSMLLTEWNLPEAVGLAVEHQSYPEFAPPDAIPGAVRNIVAVLYLAQIFYDLLKGRKPEDLHLSFLDEYLKLLGGGGQNIEEILQKKLLPVLLKKMGTYPASFRELILTYSRLNPQEG